MGSEDETADRRGMFVEDLIAQIVELGDITCADVADVSLTRIDPEGDANFPSGCTLQSPTDEQHRKASLLAAEYVESVRLALAFLKRYAPAAADAFEHLAHDLISYVCFQRVYSATDMEDIPWKRQFVYECRMVIDRQIQLLRESWNAFYILRVQPPPRFGAFRMSSFLDENDRVRIFAESDVGEAVAEASLISDADLELFLRRHVTQRWSQISADTTSLDALANFGKKLMSSVFVDGIMELFHVSKKRHEADAGLRVIFDWSKTPELTRYPWELIYDGMDFLGLSNRTPLVRAHGNTTLDRSVPWHVPIRILVSVSSPTDHPPLNAIEERVRLTDALSPLVRMGVIEIDYTRDGTTVSLQRMLRVGELNGRPYHVWHHIGHGTARFGGGLVFEDEDRSGILVGGFELSTLLNNHQSLRLVVLNCCQSAQIAESGAQAGIAMSLANRGVRTVVAMQFEVSDELAGVFAEEFYSAVIDGLRIEVALTEGRRAMFFRRSYSEWASPILVGEGDDGFSIRNVME